MSGQRFFPYEAYRGRGGGGRGWGRGGRGRGGVFQPSGFENARGYFEKAYPSAAEVDLRQSSRVVLYVEPPTENGHSTMNGVQKQPQGRSQANSSTARDQEFISLHGDEPVSVPVPMGKKARKEKRKDLAELNELMNKSVRLDNGDGDEIDISDSRNRTMAVHGEEDAQAWNNASGENHGVDDMDIVDLTRSPEKSTNRKKKEKKKKGVNDSGVRTMNELATILRGLEGQNHTRYNDIKNTFRFEDGTELIVENNPQSYASPSKIRVRCPQQVARFPHDLFRTATRRIATEDYLTRAIAIHINKSRINVANNLGRKGGDFGIDIPDQEVIERTSVSITSDYVEARMTFGLPAQSRKMILGHQACSLLTEKLPLLIAKTLHYAAMEPNDIKAFVDCIEDQEELRKLIKEAGMLAFVKNGAILPRASSSSSLPMNSDEAVKFQSPKTLEVEFDLPNCGIVRGMGIPKGVTLIVGGSFHGKSTLLEALQLGVYNHVPGDGREFVVTDESATKIRAEDGRSVTSVNITTFVNNLPFNKDTSRFCSADASGSISMAATIQEALEVGCRGLLFDEDTCATNFLMRDGRMELLVPKQHEAITPLLSKIRALYTEQGCSSILVIGGCGSYLDVADHVISMYNYTASDITADAKDLVARVPVGLFEEELRLPYGTITHRYPLIPGEISEKSSACAKNLITVSGTDVDLSALEQLVNISQSRCIVGIMEWLRGSSMQYIQENGKPLTLKEMIDWAEKEMDEKGLQSVYVGQGYVGNFVRPRRAELAGAINRLRGLRVNMSC